MPKSRVPGRRTHAPWRDRLFKAVAGFFIERLEDRICLSSAIAAFGVQQTFAVGDGISSMAVADLNRDGLQDVVTANTNASNIGVLLGNGAGGFSAQVTFAAGTQPDSVAIADVNGDGKPDLVVANLVGVNVSVLLGNGNGTFQSQTTFAAGSHLRQLTVADVNGDGKPDVILASSGTNTVNVLLGNGNGTFQAALSFATGVYPRWVAVTDVNGDGKPDLAVVNESTLSNSMSVLLGNGNGTFQAQQNYLVGGFPSSVAAADFNADGRVDLVVANSGISGGVGNTVGVLLGNGNGSFKAQQTFTASSAPKTVAVADLNGDGKLDIVTSNYSGNVDVLQGNGDGTFKPQTIFATGNSTASVVPVDLNADGRLDLVVGNYTPSASNVGVLLGDVPPTVLSINRGTPSGLSTSDSSVSYTVTFSEPVTGVDPTDFALQLFGLTASPPLVVTPVSGSVYTVTINGLAGNGSFQLNLVDDGSIHNAAGNPLQPQSIAALQPQQTFAAGSNPIAVVTADLNGDGKSDVVVVNGSANAVSVLLGNGNGTLQSPATYATGTLPDSVAVADVNGDGKLDLIAVNYTSNSVSILLGNGNGTFQGQSTFPLMSLGSGPYSVTTSDLNGDGKADLVIADKNVSNVGVLLGNGNGTFQAQKTFATGNSPRFARAADVNADGKIDLVVNNFLSSTLSVLLGNGNGTFQNQTTFATALHPLGVAIADLNGDGKADLAVTSTNDGNVGVMLGNGNGTFQSPMTFATAQSPSAVVAADMNGDGKLDLVSNGNWVSVLLGNGNGTFQNQAIFPTPIPPSYIAVSDMNRDGKPDLVVTAGGTDSDVGVLLDGNANANFSGQAYIISPSQDVITGNLVTQFITLTLDADHTTIDWRVMEGASNVTYGHMPVNDPAGLTINANGSQVFITLDNSNGNPLPNRLNLKGLFNLSGLAATGNPLANTTVDLTSSTLYINYGAPANDPMSLIQGYLKTGYNGGTWTGTAATGAIQSSSAAASPLSFAVGYADSSDAANPAGLQANTIKLRYTAIGDTDLDGTVGLPDLAALLKSFNTGTRWDQGDITYGVSTRLSDLAALLKHFNNTASSPAAVPSATPSGSATPSAAVAAAPANRSSSSLTVSVASTSDGVNPKKLARVKHRAPR